MGQGRAQRGVLEENSAGYRAFLEALGFAPVSIRTRMSQWGALGRWLAAEGLGAWELTDAIVGQCLAARRSAGRVVWVSERSLTLPLTYLRSIGAAPPETRSLEKTGTDAVLEAYRRYLCQERGLAHETQRAYLRIADAFCHSVSTGGEGLDQLTGADVLAFVVATCRTGSVASAKKTVTALASLLRYLFVAGVTAEPLSAALPGVAGRTTSSFGIGLDADAVGRLLAGCDPCRLGGVRDRAVITVLARMGLRAGEVAALKLDDVNWHRGEVVIRGKGNRLELVPLPADVGQVVAAYLRSRPAAPPGCRSVFLRLAPPLGPLAAGTVCQVVRRAARRAGLPPVGSHRLRHFAATTTLRGGAPLPEVAELLRQRSLQVTARYAHVDPAALRELARPWPGDLR